MEPLSVTPADAFKALGIGQTKGWELISTRKLETFKIGRATRVTTDSLRRYVAEQIAARRPELEAA